MYLPRGKVVVVRERFIKVLHDCVEYRKVQDETNEDGKGQRFRDARRIPTVRYPMDFYNWSGLVRDGPPTNIPEGAIVMSASGERVAA